MISKIILASAAVVALGASLTGVPPARAAILTTLESATSGSATWTYTVGASGHPFSFAPIQGTDWLGSGNGGAATAPAPSFSLAAVLPGSDPVSASNPASGSTSVPEPGALSLLGISLLFIAVVRRNRA